MRVLDAEARGVAAEGLEARRDPTGLGLPAPRSCLVEVVVDNGQDPRGDHEIAVELVPRLDLVTGVKEVLPAHPLGRSELHRPRQEVLHEDAARAGALVPGRREFVADVERVRQVVEAVDHQPVPEAVDALVKQEVSAVDLLAGTEAARDRCHLRAGDAAERALDDAVVVARPARHRAVCKRLRRIVVVADIRGVPDLVVDLVAAALDLRVRPHRACEPRERLLRAVVVGDVPERLLVTGVVALAI